MNHPAPPRPLHIIPVACALGAPPTLREHGPAEGPDALLQGELRERLRRRGLDCHPTPTLYPAEPQPAPEAPLAERLGAAGELLARLADSVATTLQAGAFPLVLGGDHAIAAGTWRGVSRAAAAPIGLLWIDAHLDAHTPDSSWTGNIHGMPMAALLGEGDEALTGLPGAHLDPAHVCVVGARSWEPEEKARLQRLGVTTYTMADVRERGLATVLGQAIAQVRRAPGGFGVSLDLDSIDPAGLPGTTCPVPLGLDADELTAALGQLRGLPELLAFELVEYVPARDPDGSSARRVAELLAAALGPDAASLRAREERYGAHNYAPLPAVFTRGRGCWLWDVHGKRYLDMMSAYSAVSFGHAHPRLLAALNEQAAQLSLTSRATSNDRLPLLLERLCRLFGHDAALPVNTGLEAVETALKAARKWAYKVKGVAPGKARIIGCEGNFHGRSITIVGLSSEAQYRDGFGPFPGGLERVPYGDAAALEAAITPDTAAFLVEPVQGEGGIRVPPNGYLARCAEICRRHRVLLIADEVQTGLGRTGRLLGVEHDGVRPDGIILGKALGGGLLPVSAFLADRPLMDVFTPGDHGSTFGGNPLGAAVALEALAILEDEDLVARSARLGAQLLAELQALRHPRVQEVRGRGLMIGVELLPDCSAALAARRLLEQGLYTKDTHGTVLRFAPPLVVDEAQLELAVATVRSVLDHLPVAETATA